MSFRRRAVCLILVLLAGISCGDGSSDGDPDMGSSAEMGAPDMAGETGNGADDMGSSRIVC